MLYQAELLSVPVAKGGPLASGGALIAMPPRPRNSQKGGLKVFSRPAFNRFAGRRRWLYTGPPDGASPSGKALDFDSSIRRFDPFRPSHPVPVLRGISSLLINAVPFPVLNPNWTVGADKMGVQKNSLKTRFNVNVPI